MGMHNQPDQRRRCQDDDLELAGTGTSPRSAICSPRPKLAGGLGLADDGCSSGSSRPNLGDFSSAKPGSLGCACAHVLGVLRHPHLPPPATACHHLSCLAHETHDQHEPHLGELPFRWSPAAKNRCGAAPRKVLSWLLTSGQLLFKQSSSYEPPRT